MQGSRKQAPVGRDRLSEQRGLYMEGNVYRRFEEFSDNLLLHRAASSPPVHTFRLCVDEKMLLHTNCYMWVRRGLRCSPAALDVRNRTYGGEEEIKLSPTMAPPAGCRRLTRLRLDNVTAGDDVMEQLDTLFPVLELRDRSYSFARITSGTLKNLTISNRERRFGFDASTASRLAPIAAAARLLKLRLDIRTGRDLAQMPSLSLKDVDTFMRNSTFLKSLCELLGSVVAGASCIELSGLESVVVEKKDYVVLDERFVSVPLLQAIFDEVQKFGVFGNLRRLVLAECDLGNDLQPLWRFQNTPVPEILYLRDWKSLILFLNYYYYDNNSNLKNIKFIILMIII